MHIFGWLFPNCTLQLYYIGIQCNCEIKDNLSAKSIIPLYTCSQTPFFVHLVNEDCSLKQFALSRGKTVLTLILSLSTYLIWTPSVNKYSTGPLSVCINRFDSTSKQGRGLNTRYVFHSTLIKSEKAKTSFHAILYILQYKLLSFVFHDFIFILERVIT